MIPAPALTPAQEAWEQEIAAAEKRSDAICRAVESGRRERIMREGRNELAREPEYAILDHVENKC